MYYIYRDEIKNDICAAIRENYHKSVIKAYLDGGDALREKFASDLYDKLLFDDSVTGNGSGSYFCNAYKAEEALCGNFDLLADALEEFGYGADAIRRGAEFCDVLIRIYMLSECIEYALDELEDAIAQETL